MIKRVNKILALVLALTMIMGMGMMVSAAETESSIPQLAKTNGEGLTVDLTAVQESLADEGDNGISPLWWAGDGPAPQVTNIVLADAGWLDNGNFGVVLKVYGYGSDTTTFNGRKITWFKKDPFIISGTGADGFYYWYDCGPITAAGDYTFSTTFRSTNHPYTQRSYSRVFPFVEN